MTKTPTNWGPSNSDTVVVSTSTRNRIIHTGAIRKTHTTGHRIIGLVTVSSKTPTNWS